MNDGTWLEKREQLLFASFQFEAVHHQLKTSTTDYDPATTLDADDEGFKNLISFHFWINVVFSPDWKTGWAFLDKKRLTVQKGF